MANNDELIAKAAETLAPTEGGEIKRQSLAHLLGMIRDLATALRAADRRIAELVGAADADENRLRQAAECAGVGYFGCDTPEVLADTIGELRQRIAELEREWDFAMNGADRLRERLAIAKDGTDKAIELIHRWGCECEPQIGFFCGPCRAVELIDDAMSAERGE